MAQRHAESASRIAALAVRSLEALHLAVCGVAPAGVRAWRDGSTLLLVLRPQEGGSVGLDYEALPVLIAEAVRARTGAALHDGRWRSEPGLGIEVFVFGLPEPSPAAGAPAHRAPAWQRWSPVPAGNVAAAAGPRRAAPLR